MEQEYNLIGGKKKKENFYFPNANLGNDRMNKIGYSKNKVKKINCSVIEIDIAKIIMKNPHKNLVKIYSVDKKKKEIIMEKFEPMPGLKTNARPPRKEEITKYLKDIKSGLNKLNKLNIAYIDLKKPNTGYSKKDKNWKIFDFDGSAMFKKNKWTIQPDYNLQQMVAIENEDLKPNEIDNYLFKYFKKMYEKKYNATSLEYLKLIKKAKKSSKKKSRKSRKSSKKKSRKSRKSSKKKSRKSSCKGLKRKSCLKKSKKCSWRSKSKRAKAYCAQKPKFSRK